MISLQVGRRGYHGGTTPLCSLPRGARRLRPQGGRFPPPRTRTISRRPVLEGPADTHGRYRAIRDALGLAIVRGKAPAVPAACRGRKRWFVRLHDKISRAFSWRGSNACCEPGHDGDRKHLHEALKCNCKKIKSRERSYFLFIRSILLKLQTDAQIRG